MTKRSTLILCAILSAALLPAFAQSAPAYKDQIWFDSSQPLDKRVDALVHAMTLEEKVGQMVNGAPAIPRLGVPAYDYWSEGLHGIARSGYATLFPQAIGLAVHLGRAPPAPGRRRHLHRSARQIRAGHARQPAQHLFRTHHLVAEHQHLPRSALGPRPGNLRRRSLPHQPHGRRLRRRSAGGRPEVLPHHRHAEALRRAQRPRAAPPRIQRRPLTPRP